jgi:hypothetical protein
LYFATLNVCAYAAAGASAAPRRTAGRIMVASMG